MKSSAPRPSCQRGYQISGTSSCSSGRLSLGAQWGFTWVWSTLSLHFFGVLNIICATNQSHSCYCKCELAVGCSASTGSLPALRNSRLKSSHLGECDVRCKRILKGILVISTFPGFSVFQKIEQEAPAAAVPRCCSLQSHFVQCLGGWGTKNYRPEPAGNGRRCIDTYEYEC